MVETYPTRTSQRTHCLTLMGLAAVSVAAVIGAIAYHLWTERSPSPPMIATTATPSHATAIAASGRLEPQGEVINLSAPASVDGAKVEHLLVALGDHVQTGQVIAILDNRDRLQAARERANARVRVSQARLAKVLAGAKVGEIQAQQATIEKLQTELNHQTVAKQAIIERLKIEAHNATTDCTRYQTLFRDGAIAAADRDDQCLRQDSFQAQLIEAQANYQDTLGSLQKQLQAAQGTLAEIIEVRPVDVTIAQAELTEAQAAVAQAQANLELVYVRAPQMGQVLKIETRPGERVNEKGIVVLGQTEQMYAVAEVYETDIHHIRLGQNATITSLGFIGELSGTVAEIGLQIGKNDVLQTDPAADVDARVVEVKIRLDSDASQQVRDFTNLQINVVIHTSASTRVS